MSNPRNASLIESEFTEAQRELRNSKYDKGRRALRRHIEMPDFPQAIAFMVRVAIEAERTGHHPEWSNVFNRVNVWLTTYNVQGVSDRDLAMAATSMRSSETRA